MKALNHMTRAQLVKEQANNSKRQAELSEELIHLGYGRVLSFDLCTLTDVSEALEKDALMRRASAIAMELDSIELGYRKAGLPA